MANSNSPYGFRLYGRLSGGSGTFVVAPGMAAGGDQSSTGPLAVASATVLSVGDPIKATLGLGVLATTTMAIFGICNSPVPNFLQTAIAKHYPEIIPVDDNTILECQSIGTTKVTQGYIGVVGSGLPFTTGGLRKLYRIGGGTSGYLGIDLTHTTGGMLQIVGLSPRPGNTLATYAQLLVVVARGPFVGSA